MSSRTPKASPSKGAQLSGVSSMDHSYADASQLRGITEKNKDQAIKSVGGPLKIDSETGAPMAWNYDANGKIQFVDSQGNASGEAVDVPANQYVSHKYPVPLMPADPMDTKMRFLQALGDPARAPQILGPEVGGVLGNQFQRFSGWDPDANDGKGAQVARGIEVEVGPNEFVDYMARKEAEIQKHNFWNWSTRQFDTKNPADLEKYNKLFPEVVGQQEQIIDHYLELAGRLHKIRLRGAQTKDDMYLLYLVDQGYIKNLEASIPGIGDLGKLNKSGVEFTPGLLNPLRYIDPTWIGYQNPVNESGDPLHNANKARGVNWGGTTPYNSATSEQRGSIDAVNGIYKNIPTGTGARYY